MGEKTRGSGPAAIHENKLGDEREYLRLATRDYAGFSSFRTGAGRIVRELAKCLPNLPGYSAGRAELCRKIAESVYPLAARLLAQAVEITLSLSPEPQSFPTSPTTMMMAAGFDIAQGNMLYAFVPPNRRRWANIPRQKEPAIIASGLLVTCRPLRYRYHAIKDSRKRWKHIKSDIFKNWSRRDLQRFEEELKELEAWLGKKPRPDPALKQAAPIRKPRASGKPKPDSVPLPTPTQVAPLAAPFMAPPPATRTPQMQPRTEKATPEPKQGVRRRPEPAAAQKIGKPPTSRQEPAPRPRDSAHAASPEPQQVPPLLPVLLAQKASPVPAPAAHAARKTLQLEPILPAPASFAARVRPPPAPSTTPILSAPSQPPPPATLPNTQTEKISPLADAESAEPLETPTAPRAEPVPLIILDTTAITAAPAPAPAPAPAAPPPPRAAMTLTAAIRPTQEIVRPMPASPSPPIPAIVVAASPPPETEPQLSVAATPPPPIAPKPAPKQLRPEMSAKKPLDKPGPEPPSARPVEMPPQESPEPQPPETRPHEQPRTEPAQPEPQHPPEPQQPGTQEPQHPQPEPEAKKAEPRAERQEPAIREREYTARSEVTDRLAPESKPSPRYAAVAPKPQATPRNVRDFEQPLAQRFRAHYYAHEQGMRAEPQHVPKHGPVLVATAKPEPKAERSATPKTESKASPSQRQQPQNRWAFLSPSPAPSPSGFFTGRTTRKA